MGTQEGLVAVPYWDQLIGHRRSHLLSQKLSARLEEDPTEHGGPKDTLQGLEKTTQRKEISRPEEQSFRNQHRP